MPESLIGVLPSDFYTTTLGELCRHGGGDIQTGPFGSQLHAADYVPTGVPSVMPQNIVDNRINDDGIARISTRDAGRLSRYLLRAGDIVYSRRGDVGRRALVRPEHDGWLCGTGCLRVRLGSAADSRFVYYYLGHPETREWVARHAVGATMPNLNTSILSAAPVAVPPTHVQNSVGELLGALDDKISANERISATALALAEAIYLHSEKSFEWNDVALADAATWYSGGTPRTSNSEFWGGDVPWISALSLKSPWITESDRNLTPRGAVSGTRLVPRGTIIFVVRGSSLKKEFRIGVTQREVAFGQDCKALIPKSGIDSDLLLHAIRARTPDVLELVDETGIGAGRLNTDLIGRLTVRVPHAEGDPTVVALRCLNRLAAAREQENTKLAELRDQLLPKLMSGEIKVRDAEAVVSEAT